MILLTAQVGCQFKGGPGAVRGVGADEDVWRPRPASMRIYPSTRFIQEQGQSLLQVQLEFRDQMGDAVKAVGAVRLELFAVERPGDSRGRRLYIWPVQLLALEDRQRFFDSITRTYRIQLQLDSPQAAQRSTLLRATFTPADASPRLQAEARLPQ